MRAVGMAPAVFRFDRMARSGAWIERLPRWLTVPDAANTTGPSLGPRERLMLAIALAVIAIWGFSGSWEFPAIEKAAPRVEFVASASVDQPVAAGEELFQANGCYACHSIAGERKIGPSLNGIFGATVELDDGSVVPVDDAYLIESILEPEVKRVAGYDDAAMPSYEGLLTEQDARLLTEYLKSLDF